MSLKINYFIRLQVSLEEFEAEKIQLVLKILQLHKKIIKNFIERNRQKKQILVFRFDADIKKNG